MQDPKGIGGNVELRSEERKRENWRNSGLSTHLFTENKAEEKWKYTNEYTKQSNLNHRYLPFSLPLTYKSFL